MLLMDEPPRPAIAVGSLSVNCDEPHAPGETDHGPPPDHGLRPAACMPAEEGRTHVGCL